MLSVSLVVFLCLVYIRLCFPVLFKSVTTSDVTGLKIPWAIELKMEMEIAMEIVFYTNCSVEIK